MSLKNITLHSDGHVLLNDISFSVEKNESVAITGPSGSGKTILAKTIAGLLRPQSGTLQFNLPDNTLRLFVPQQHDFRSIFPERSYYQQRYDHNYSESLPSVLDLFKKRHAKILPDSSEISYWMSLLEIENLKERKLIELSNGEGKRVQLVNALLSKPGVLILDNPFVGLDKEARETLRQVVQNHLPEDTLIILITSPEEIPDYITTVVELNKGGVNGIFPRKEYTPTWKEEGHTLILNDLSLFRDTEKEAFHTAIEIKDLTMGYGDKIILRNINWKVNKGECWALRGHNGSGKSTLISLLNGDNPQAYGQELYLFDRKRGSGESIWELKERIGYVSPELHLYFQRDPSYTEELAINAEAVNDSGYGSSITCFEVICSGFNEVVGLTDKLSEGQTIRAKEWMKALDLEPLSKRSYYSLSNGEQRLTLLARALVKNPPLLILDEPCQGLDHEQSRRFIQLIDELCVKLEKTLLYVSHYDHELPNCINHKIELQKGTITLII